MSARGRHLLVGLSITVASAVMITSAQQPPAPAAGPFTAAQADSGRQLYLANCASCHGAELAGPPALKGQAFMGTWGSQTTNALYDKIRTSMPPEAPGSLGPDNYSAVVAYLLQQNGQTPGTAQLSAGTAVLIQPQAGAPQGAPAGQQAGAGQGHRILERSDKLKGGASAR